jgi:hypothetical protein
MQKMKNLAENFLRSCKHKGTATLLPLLLLTTAAFAQPHLQIFGVESGVI